MNDIRITRIQVYNLFGDTNYDIDLRDNKPIAIITAPNGKGKTTILNLISVLFAVDNKTFSSIEGIPFDTFRCTLSNGKTVELKTKIEEQINPEKQRKTTKAERLLRERAKEFGNEGPEYAFSIYSKDGRRKASMVFSESFDEDVERLFRKYMREKDDLFFLRDSHMSPEVRFEYLRESQRMLLEKEGCEIPINYIKADRIQPIAIFDPRTRHDEMRTGKSPLRVASETVSKMILEATEKYNEEVSKAKDRLPQMFLEGVESRMEYDSFIDGWKAYRKELDQFQDIGLISPTKDFTKGKDISRVYQEKGEFLSTYLSAFKDTTLPLKDIYTRLSLFKQILDERNAITEKKLTFSRNGISLTSGKHSIPLEMLSSGEKHDFIMFYKLIFDASHNGLVLIDEPEISLHIEWQETYLNKLLEICEMNNLKAIVATHSPNIVSSHYDFLVDKGETRGYCQNN